MKAGPWLRSWRGKIYSRKVWGLSDAQYRTWDLLLCLTDGNGNLPSIDDMAFHLRTTSCDMERRLAELVESRFIDPVGTGPIFAYRAHDWPQWQRVWDGHDRTAKHRMSRYRKRKKTAVKIAGNGSVTRNVTVAVTENRSESVSGSVGTILSASPAASVEVFGHEGMLVPHGDGEVDPL